MPRSTFLATLVILCLSVNPAFGFGSPISLIDGCTDALACNYDPTADTDDGSCEYDSCVCTDPLACNYDPEATGGGIQETFTENFDWMFAETVFADQFIPLNDYIQSGYFALTSGTWEVLDNSSFACDSQSSPNSITWNTVQTTGDATFSFSSPASGISFNSGGGGTNTYTLTHDGGTAVYSYPGGGDAGTLISFTETGVTSIYIQTTQPGCLDDFTYTVGVEACVYPGCEDPLACNYDPEAGCSDDSCDYESCVGCTDPLACNYDPDAIPGDALETFFEDFDSVFAPTIYADQFQPVSDYVLSPYLSMTAGDWEVLDISSFQCDALSEPNSITWNPSVTTTFATFEFSLPATNVSFYIADNVNLTLTVTHDGGTSVYSLYGNGDAGLLVDLAENGITTLAFSDTDHFGCLDNLTYSVGADPCVYPGCLDEIACNYEPEAGCEGDNCDYESCAGCTDPLASNFDPDATLDDGSCVYSECGGCLDPEACNFNPSATVDNEICYFAPVGYNCDGTCIDADEDGVCDFLTEGYPGCTAASAINFQPGASTDDGSCVFPSEICGSGTLWDFSIGQCVGLGDCSCPGDLNSDGLVGTVDLLAFLALFGSPCPF